MNLKDFTTGVKILAPYYDDPDGYHIGAEHDQFYMYATDKPVSKSDLEDLVNAGWFQDDVTCEDGVEFGPENYDQEEGWSYDPVNPPAHYKR